jgi:hypothetical protein
MGGQQFGEAGILVDTRDLNRVLAFDAERGTITVEGDIQWRQRLAFLNREQEGRGGQWGIYQKQTGADRLSVAGASSCNAHGRGRPYASCGTRQRYAALIKLITTLPPIDGVHLARQPKRRIYTGILPEWNVAPVVGQRQLGTVCP